MSRRDPDDEPIYCADPMCDGHLFSWQKCPPWPAPLEPEPESHDADPVSWFGIGRWGECTCGYAPRDNVALAKHWASHGFTILEDHGTLVKTPVE